MTRVFFPGSGRLSALLFFLLKRKRTGEDSSLNAQNYQQSPQASPLQPSPTGPAKTVLNIGFLRCFRPFPRWLVWSGVVEGLAATRCKTVGHRGSRGLVTSRVGSRFDAGAVGGCRRFVVENGLGFCRPDVCPQQTDRPFLTAAAACNAINNCPTGRLTVDEGFPEWPGGRRQEPDRSAAAGR